MNKKIFKGMSKAAIATIIATTISIPAFAKVDAILVENKEGKLIQYSRSELKLAEQNNFIGVNAPLFDEYMKHTVKAFHDDKVGYVKFDDVKNAEQDAFAHQGNFKLDSYTEKVDPKDTIHPDKPVVEESFEDGKLVHKPVETEKDKADKVAAKVVEDKINGLKVESLTLEDAEKVNGIIEEFNGLTDAQRALIPLEVKDNLKNATNKIVELKEVEEVVVKINGLKVESLTLEDEEKVNGIIEEFNGLTDAQRALIPLEIKDNLKNATNKIVELKEVEEVVVKINGLKVESLTLEDEEKVNGIIEEFNGLTDAQRALIPLEVKDNLKNATNKIVELKEAE